MLLEDAQDVGDLLAAIGAGAAPADHDPLADIGRCQPDLKPVAHACHLSRLGVSRRIWPGHDAAADRGVAAAAGQRASAGRTAGRAGWAKNLVFSAVS
jgi:hypothetical protein